MEILYFNKLDYRKSKKSISINKTSIFLKRTTLVNQRVKLDGETNSPTHYPEHLYKNIQ